MATVTDDISSLCKVIGLLLASPLAVKTTEVVDSDSATGQSQQPPYQWIEVLHEEAKQILRKYYVPKTTGDEQSAIMSSINTPAVLDQRPSAQRPQLYTFLVSFFEAKISELKVKKNSNNTELAATDDQLPRYVLIAALSYAVVGIVNLLSGDYPTPSSPSTSSPSNLESCNRQLSTNQESLIRLAIGHTVRTAFKPILQHYLGQSVSLFPTSRSLECQLSVKAEEIFMLKPIYLLFIAMLLQESPTSFTAEVIRRDVYCPLIACFAIYRRHNQLKTNINCFSGQLADTEVSLRKQFEQYIAVLANQDSVIRELLLLIRSQPNVFLKPILVNLLFKYFTQPHGLEIVLRSTLDSDVTSERETTITDRLVAIASMITGLPVRDRTNYFENILKQIVGDLLVKEQHQLEENATHAVDIYWRTGALVLKNIDAEQKALVKSMVFEEILRVLSGEKGSLIKDIETAILIVNRLFLSRVCIEHLVPLFVPLFYIRLAFEKKIASIRTILEETLTEALTEIPESYYLLDDCLYEKVEQWIGRFDTEIDDSGPELLYCIRVRPTEETISPERTLELVKSLTKMTLSTLERMSLSYRYNYLFILLDRLIAPPEAHSCLQSLVFLELVGPLGEGLLGATITKAQEEEREGRLFADQRTMQFLAMTFQKVVEQLTKEPPPVVNLDDEEQPSQWTRSVESLQFCLGALELLVMKEEKTVLRKQTNEELEVAIRQQLKSCHISLSRLLKWKHFDDLLEDGQLMRLSAEGIFIKLEKLIGEQAGEEQTDLNDDLERCLRELRHPLMPIQAHALITIKQLIYRRDKALEDGDKVAALLEQLKQCLQNSDSYIYLAAINALGLLAIRQTDQVMPVLLEQFAGDDLGRPLADRLKTGEVLRQLARSIGDYAYHYSELFIGRLLTAVKAPEPELRMSALSCLGEYCAAFRHGLGKHLVELNSMVASLATDSTATVEVKRAAVLFLRLLLQGLDGDGAMLVPEQLTAMNRTLKKYDNVLDDVLQLQAQLAKDELARIVGELTRFKGKTVGERDLVQLR